MSTGAVLPSQRQTESVQKIRKGNSHYNDNVTKNKYLLCVTYMFVIFFFLVKQQLSINVHKCIDNSM